MARIESIYDAIIKTQVKEAQCTNFLLWLLNKLPPRIMLEIFKISDLPIYDVESNFGFQVQYLLENSKPDGLIEFLNGKYLIIETKLFPNAFNKEQFIESALLLKFPSIPN